MPSPNKADGLPPKAPDLSETAEALARGRELVKQAQRSAEKADQQIEEAQATIQQSDRLRSVSVHGGGGNSARAGGRVHASNRSDSRARPTTTHLGLEMGAYVSADEAVKLPDLA